MSNMKSICILACFFAFVNSSYDHHCHDSPTDQKIRLKSDNGKYLARCRNCGPGAYPDSAFVHITDGHAPYAQWKVEMVGEQVAFKSDNGKYLARCHNCWKGGAAYKDSAFIHVSHVHGNPWALWTPIEVGNYKWAFKADNGQFLARCNHCVKGGAKPDSAFVHQCDIHNPWAQWTVEVV